MTMWPLLTLLPSTNMSACLTPALASAVWPGLVSVVILWILQQTSCPLSTSTAVICTTAAIMIGSEEPAASCRGRDHDRDVRIDAAADANCC